MKTHSTIHLVKPADLNHHHTLYAAKAIEWMIDACFIAAAKAHGSEEGLVYKNIHEFNFYEPFTAGDMVGYRSTIVRTGNTSLTMRVGVYDELTGELRAEGYSTYVTIEEGTTKSVPCNIIFDDTNDEEELKWREKADSFFK